MDAVIGPYLAAVALLAVGGAPKTWAPADTSRGLRAMRLPVGPLAVRIMGAAEVATAVSAVLRPGPVSAIAVAAWYVVFAAVVVVALRSRAPLSSCGCFGAVESPPSLAHLALVVLAAAVSIVTATTWSGGLLVDQPAHGVPFVGFVALAAWFGYLVMTRLAALGRTRT